MVGFLRRAGFGMGKGGAQGELPTEHDDAHITKCIHFTSSAMMYKDIIIKFIMFTMRFNNKNAWVGRRKETLPPNATGACSFVRRGC